MSSANPPTSNVRPTKIAAILFPGFQLLDFAGPMDAFNILSNIHPLELHIVASTLEPVSTQSSAQFSQSVMPTHTFKTAHQDYDMLLMPGGKGSREAANKGVLEEVVGWLKSLDLGKEVGSEKRKRWVLTVCTGSEILARTGVLDGRRATTNKRAWGEVCFLFFIVPFSSLHCWSSIEIPSICFKTTTDSRLGHVQTPTRKLGAQSALG